MPINFTSSPTETASVDRGKGGEGRALPIFAADQIENRVKLATRNERRWFWTAFIAIAFIPVSSTLVDVIIARGAQNGDPVPLYMNVAVLTAFMAICIILALGSLSDLFTSIKIREEIIQNLLAVDASRSSGVTEEARGHGEASSVIGLNAGKRGLFQ